MTIKAEAVDRIHSHYGYVFGFPCGSGYTNAFGKDTSTQKCTLERSALRLGSDHLAFHRLTRYHTIPNSCQKDAQVQAPESLWGYAPHLHWAMDCLYPTKAGVQWEEAYAFAEANNITLVGGQLTTNFRLRRNLNVRLGSDKSVGASGGWLQVRQDTQGSHVPRALIWIFREVDTALYRIRWDWV